MTDVVSAVSFIYSRELIHEQLKAFLYEIESDYGGDSVCY